MFRGNSRLARLNRLRRLKKGLNLTFDNEHPLPTKNPYGMNSFVGTWNESILFQNHLRSIQKRKQPKNSKGQFTSFPRNPYTDEEVSSV